jgi:cytoskeletal protein CcmA (bactofilin family)
MALFNKDTASREAASASEPSAPPSKPRSTAVNPAEQHNIIGKDTVIEGTLRSTGNVHISGAVNGNLEVQGRTVVMPEGRVEGEVNSTTAEIGGRIHGQVTVKERLVLKATAVVEGDIRTGKLVIEDGATFTGRCDMGGTGAAGPRRPRPEGAEREDAGEGRPTRRLGGSPDPASAAQV